MFGHIRLDGMLIVFLYKLLPRQPSQILYRFLKQVVQVIFKGNFRLVSLDFVNFVKEFPSLSGFILVFTHSLSIQEVVFIRVVVDEDMFADVEFFDQLVSVFMVGWYSHCGKFCPPTFFHGSK